MRLLSLLFALAPALPAQDPSPGALRKRLWELDEVRAASRLATEFLPHVRPGGALAEDGEALALVARAAIETGDTGGAGLLLGEARVTSGANALEIERARLLFARDELEEASRALSSEDEDGRRGEARPRRAPRHGAGSGAAELRGSGRRGKPGGRARASRALSSEDERGLRMRFPEEPGAWILFARTHARLQDYAAADQAARQYLRLAPFGRGSAVAWQIRTDAALRRNDGEAAHAFLKEAKRHRRWHELLVARRIQRRRDPEAELPQLGLGLLRMEARQYETARTHFLGLTRRKPGYARGWFHLGESERMLGRSEEAEAAYDRALGCDEAHAPSRANRATLRLARGEIGGARGDLVVLLAGPAGEDPRYLESHLQLSRLLLRDGAPEEARARYGRYRELGGQEPLEP